MISKLTKTTGLLGASHDNEQTFDVLLGYLNHEDDRIRANTIEGIGGLQTSRKLPILLDTMLKDSSERKANGFYRQVLMIRFVRWNSSSKVNVRQR